MIRPRGGQIWRRKADGVEVWVEARHSINPMRGVRSLNKDAWWNMVLWEDENEHWGAVHEADFVNTHDFVSQPRKTE
jgi:hypothetical protein